MSVHTDAAAAGTPPIEIESCDLISSSGVAQVEGLHGTAYRMTRVSAKLDLTVARLWDSRVEKCSARRNWPDTTSGGRRWFNIQVCCRFAFPFAFYNPQP